MQRALLTGFFAFLALIGALLGQDYRTYDGFGNNLEKPEWGAAGTPFTRLAPVSYGDGISTLGGVGWPNPRLISNELFDQNGPLIDPLTLSDYTWVWGQFVDHDLTFALDDPTGWVYIQVPLGDPWFDPWNIGQALIVMRRTQPHPGTGTSPANPRQHTNVISSFLDASGVYGSSEEAANWLRSFEGGKMKISNDNLLPFNTVDGQYGSDVDPTAPHMDDPIGQFDYVFVAGDARANENPLLAGFHTLFVREHNRLCDELAQEHPDWNDEQLYQYARKMVGGFIQVITFEEWLPAMGLELPAYQGYDDTVNPTISNLFSAAAFRLGHTLLTDTIRRMDLDGNPVPEGDLPLRDAFFNPMELTTSGMDCFFKGMGVQVQNQMDNKVISAVRNFLFGEPGSGGLDLAAINITRARERGIPDFNKVREALGMTPYGSFADLTADQEVIDQLNSLYTTIDHLDLWVGLLAEDPMPDALFGPTLMKILKDQFQALRDGDRFYYLNDPLLSAEDKQEIHETRLVDIVTRNTNIEVMQENLFVAMPHEMLCLTEEAASTIQGSIWTENTLTVGEVEVDVQVAGLGTSMGSMITGLDGVYAVDELPTCDGYEVIPFRNDAPDAGVSTMDLVLIQKHILGQDLLDSPYQLIAADANNSGTVSTLDMVDIRKVILVVSDNFTNNTSWRFVDADYIFPDPTNPFAEAFPETVIVPNLQDITSTGFIAVKIGDVNNSVDPNGLDAPIAGRGGSKVLFEVQDQLLPEQVVQQVDLYLPEQNLQGYQFTLNYDPALVEFVELTSNQFEAFSATNYHHMADVGAVNVSWNGTVETKKAQPVLTAFFKANTTDVQLSEFLSINSRYVTAEAYNSQLETMDVGLLIRDVDGAHVMYHAFELYQNAPNPVQTSTNITFYLPEAGAVTLSFYDELGRMLHQVNGDFAAGKNDWILDQAAVKLPTGIITYQLESDFGTASRTMVVVK